MEIAVSSLSPVSTQSLMPAAARSAMVSGTPSWSLSSIAVAPMISWCAWVEGGGGGWLDGWMDGWMSGWMDGWIDGGMDGWMDGWIDGGRDRGMERERDGCACELRAQLPPPPSRLKTTHNPLLCPLRNCRQRRLAPLDALARRLVVAEEGRELGAAQLARAEDERSQTWGWRWR